MTKEELYMLLVAGAFFAATWYAIQLKGIIG